MSAETITLFAADGTIDRNPSVEPRLQRALTEIYGRVSHMPLFPKGGECLTATVGLSLEYGLKGQAGWFLVDEPTDPEGVKDRFQTHFWTHAGFTIYDLLHTQFNPFLKEQLPEGIIIVEMGNPLYQRYITPNHPFVEQFGLDRGEDFNLRDYR